MSSQFPFNTPLGRFLDSLSRHPRLHPYVMPVRRVLRKLWSDAAANPNFRVFLTYVTPQRVVLAFSVLSLLIVGIITLHVSRAIHRGRIEADINRVSNLQQIRLDVRQFHLKRGRLPETLKELQSDKPNPHYVRDDHFYDPESLALIEYKTVSPDEYSLCAKFYYTSESVAAEVPDSGVDGPVWRHQAGYHCFEFAVATNQPSSVAQ